MNSHFHKENAISGPLITIKQTKIVAKSIRYNKILHVNIQNNGIIYKQIDR